MGEGYEGDKKHIGERGKERWVRVKGRKGWRGWKTGKRTKREIGEIEVVVWIDGEEWAVFH